MKGISKPLIKRAVHYDFHTMPKIYDFNREWDAEKFAQKLADAEVTYINLFAQCNIGFSYYPTKIGVPYPGMKGDMFGDALKACHKRGIKVTAYINGGLNHEAALRHQEWLRVNKEGQIIHGSKTDHFCRTMCLGTGYKDYILSIIDEINSSYDIDGLFIDCLGPRPCYCEKCISKMQEDGEDIYDDAAVLRHSYKLILELGSDARKIIGDDKFLYLNGPNYFDMKNLVKHIEVECLPGGWGYDHFLKSASYARNITDTVLYMTGRFQKSWGDFGGYKPVASIENDFYDAVSNGCQLCLGDHIHPAEIMEERIIEDLGRIYKRFELYEKWTDKAGYLSEIAVIADVENEASLSGLSRMLSELKYNFDILDYRDYDKDYSPFACLILADYLDIDEKLGKKISQYIAGGGKVLSSGFAAVNKERTGFVLPEWDFEFCGTDKSNASYFTFNDMPCVSAHMRYSLYKEGVLIKAREGGESLAEYWKPYFNVHWDGHHGYSYTPPEKKTGEQAAVISKGVEHICFRIFEAYYECALREHKLLVGQILNKLIPDKLIYTEGLPSTSRVTATGNDDYALVHCKVTFPEVRGKMDIIEEHVRQVAGAMAGLSGKYKSAYILPEEKPLAVSYDGRYSKVVLPEFEGFIMIRFDK